MNAAIKNAEISRRILAEVNAGKTLAAAIDTVLGGGTYDALVADLYDTLRN